MTKIGLTIIILSATQLIGLALDWELSNKIAEIVFSWGETIDWDTVVDIQWLIGLTVMFPWIIPLAIKLFNYLKDKTQLRQVLLQTAEDNNRRVAYEYQELLWKLSIAKKFNDVDAIARIEAQIAKIKEVYDVE